MTDINKFFEQWVDAWNSNEPEKIKPFYKEDFVFYQAPVKKTLVGVKHIIARANDFAQMSSDARLSIRELHINGNTAVMEFNVKGTSTGRFLNFEPTGLKIDIDSCLSFKVENNKIAKQTTYLDTATILRAIGMLEIPGTLPEAA